MSIFNRIRDLDTHEIIKLAGQAIKDQGVNLDNIASIYVLDEDEGKCGLEILYFDYTRDFVDIPVSTLIGE